MKGSFPGWLLLFFPVLATFFQPAVVANALDPAYSTAGFFAVPDSPRNVWNFNLGWRFYRGDVPNAQNSAFDDGAWTGASLPHGLEVAPENVSGCRNYQGPAWYRKKFTVPDGAAGHQTFIYFEAVMGKCEVWVNGEPVAEHFGGYLPFAVDVTRVVHPAGQPNVVAVRADNSDDDSYPPGKPQYDLDFTYLGGIYRDAYLIQTSPVHVTLPELSPTVAGGGVFVGVKDIADDGAALEVRTEVTNAGPNDANVTVQSILEDADGKRLPATVRSLAAVAAGASQPLIQEMNPRTVHLWTPDDPYLHFVRTEIFDDGKLVDSFRTRFGFRLIGLSAKEGLMVNKKPWPFLSGVNRHQDYAYVGNALPKSGQWRDAQLLREGGSTVVRAAHEVLSPAFMDACDQLGLFVIDPNPGWQFYNDRNPDFARRMVEDTRGMVRRDRNRPSLLLYETALNETSAQPTKVIHELHLAAHEEFPFPGMYTVGDRETAHPAGLDVSYHALPSDDVASFIREYGDGYEVDDWSSQNAPVRVKREWGEHALLDQLMARARYLSEVYPHDNSRQYFGATLWAGIDHQRGYHPDPFWGGLLDVFRIPRPAYYLYKSQYDPALKVPGIHTGPMVHITNELTQISEPDVIVLTNCEQVRLTWMGLVIGTRGPDEQYKNFPHPPVTFKNAFDFRDITRDKHHPKPLVMVAEGLIKGQVVCQQTKEYAQRTTGVKLQVDGGDVPLTADGSDLIPIRANLVDQKGVTKVLGSEFVHFTVEGAGTLIGSEANEANPIKTQFGTATALVRATAQAGPIKVTATVRGLEPDSVTFQSVPVSMPLLYDQDYARASKTEMVSVATATQTFPENNVGEDVQNLRQRVHELELQLTGKQQELMNLQSKIGAP